MNYKNLTGKTVYAFGDSIVYGHTAPELSFMQLIAEDCGMKLGMYAVNGATVVTADSLSKEADGEQTENNYIINQVYRAPDAAPDIIVFDGYTNDAYTAASPDHIDIWEHLGTAGTLDSSTFYGGFEKIISEMRRKWGDVPIVFVTIHKSSARDWDTQCKLREIALEICRKSGVYVADAFTELPLDTRIAEHREKYIMGGSGSHPNLAACREFYQPFVSGKMNEAAV